MEKLVIQGRTRLHGEVTISGAKNAAVALIPATLLINGVCTLENLPNISDVQIQCEILKELGATIEWLNPNTARIDTSTVENYKAPLDKTSKFRASYYLIGALLSRFHNVEVGLPGGCNLGARPIDQHIKGFEALGAKVEVATGKVTASAEDLIGAPIYMDTVSVGATINIMLASVFAKGTTTIDNAAKEPHIVDVANFLNSIGADIRGAGTDIIKINGVEKLKSGSTYSVVPDQIEAGTFMLAAMATGGDIVLKNCISEHLDCLTAKIIEMGGEFKFNRTLTNIIIENNKIKEVVLNNKEKLPCDNLILAIGHSARDTFKLLYDKKLGMISKPFAIGIRVQHPQSMIDKNQYGSENLSIGASSYKLTYKASNNRGVYSFCMCPGGYVVNASSDEIDSL